MFFFLKNFIFCYFFCYFYFFTQESNRSLPAASKKEKNLTEVWKKEDSMRHVQNYDTSGCLVSQGYRRGKLPDSTWQFYKNNQIVKIINYKNGKKNGYSLTIDSEKQAKVEAYYIDNLLDSISKIFVKKNDEYLLKKVVHYKKSKKEGFTIELEESTGLVKKILFYQNDKVVYEENINRYNAKGQKEGLWKSFYDFFHELKIHKECEYKNDVLNGFCKVYDSQGNIVRFELYENGLLLQDEKEKILQKKELFSALSEQKTIQWVNNGVKKVIFFDESRQKKIQVWDLDDRKLAEGCLDSVNQKKGFWTYYYPTGGIKSQGNYKNGKREGEWNFFYESGALEQTGAYEEGRFSGTWTTYYETQTVMFMENYEDGELHGVYVQNNPDGKMIVKGQYKNGLKTGPWTEHIWKYFCKGEYKQSLKQGMWTCYYFNNKKHSEGLFLNGMKEGKHTVYFVNQGVMKVENWKRGALDGEYLEYNENNDLVFIMKYKMNQPIINVF